MSPLPPTEYWRGAKSRNLYSAENPATVLHLWVGFDTTELDQSKSSRDASQEENEEKGISYRLPPLYLLSSLSGSSASDH